MFLFRNSSVQRKLKLIIILTSFAVLWTAGAVYWAYFWKTQRQELVEHYSNQARLIANASTAALVNHDPLAVRELMAALSADSHIMSCRIYDEGGAVFASYQRSGEPEDARLLTPPVEERAGFVKGHVEASVKVEFQDKLRGWVFVRGDARRLYEQFWKSLLLLCAIMAGASGLAVLIASRVHWIISRPILDLARTANEVAANNNYSIRAIKQSDDDLGHLVGSFNWMLTQIQARDAELEKNRAELEKRVAERTEELSRANERLQQEVQERRRAEEALRNSQQKLLLHVQQTPLGVIDWNLDFEAINWNPSAEAIFGYKESEVIGRNACDLIVPPQKREAAGKAWKELLHNQGGQHSVQENCTKDGRLIICEWFNTPLVSLDGRVVGVSSLVQDITRRQQAEQALRESEERFEKAFRASPLPIAIATLDGARILDVNDIFLQLFGYAREEMLRVPVHELNLWNEPAEFLQIWQRLLESGRLREVVCKLRHKNGGLRTVLVSAEKIELGKEPCFLMITQDITERLNLEEQLRHSQKMEAIGQLAAGVAHDFNNILTIIQGHSVLVQRRLAGNPNEALSESLRQITEAAERAATLVRQLLAFSRRQVMQPRLLDLNEVVKNLSRMLRRTLGEDIQLDIKCAESLAGIHADPGMIEQVILNLVVNARDAMPNGGRLTLATSTVSFNGDNLSEQSERRAGEFVCLSVADTGCGMAPEVKQRIFEPFFTTKEVGKGTGLGLSMVYGIVKQHEGWIEVESQLGIGTCFRIYFPVRQQAPGASVGQETPTAIEDINGNGEVILVVEDEPGLRDLVKNVLEFYGYRVLTASSGVEAQKVWTKADGAVDLLVTDMVMPDGISGKALAEKLLAQKPGLKVIYTSGYSIDLVHKNFALKQGFNFVPKPFHPVALTRAVHDCLAGKSITPSNTTLLSKDATSSEKNE